jgi:uncharacterized membrane protein YsdA (DUF1294 family)
MRGLFFRETADLSEFEVIVVGLAGYFAVNAMTFVAFWIDKTAARNGWRRVGESTLMSFVAIGGSVGGKLGQHLLRHKTIKQPFARWLNFWTICHFLIAAISVYLLANGRPWAVQVL